MRISTSAKRSIVSSRDVYVARLDIAELRSPPSERRRDASKGIDIRLDCFLDTSTTSPRRGLIFARPRSHTASRLERERGRHVDRSFSILVRHTTTENKRKQDNNNNNKKEREREIRDQFKIDRMEWMGKRSLFETSVMQQQRSTAALRSISFKMHKQTEKPKTQKNDLLSQVLSR